MDVLQLLNPVPPLETPLRSRHTSAKKGDQQQVTRFIHISGYHVPFPAAIDSSKQAIEYRQRRKKAGRNYRESKRLLREELARTQQQLEHTQRVNKYYQGEVSRLQQKLELSAGDADAKTHSTGCHEQKSPSTLPPYTARGFEWKQDMVGRPNQSTDTRNGNNCH